MQDNLSDGERDVVRKIKEGGVPIDEYDIRMKPLGAYADDRAETHRKNNDPVEGLEKPKEEAEEE